MKYHVRYFTYLVYSIMLALNGAYALYWIQKGNILMATVSGAAFFLLLKYYLMEDYYDP